MLGWRTFVRQVCSVNFLLQMNKSMQRLPSIWSLLAGGVISDRRIGRSACVLRYFVLEYILVSSFYSLITRKVALRFDVFSEFMECLHLLLCLRQVTGKQRT